METCFWYDTQSLLFFYGNISCSDRKIVLPQLSWRTSISLPLNQSIRYFWFGTICNMDFLTLSHIYCSIFPPKCTLMRSHILTICLSSFLYNQVEFSSFLNGIWRGVCWIFHYLWKCGFSFCTIYLKWYFLNVIIIM